MKKTLLIIFFFGLVFGASAQYHRLAKQGRVWYSYQKTYNLWWTSVYAIQGDTLVYGTDYSWLVQVDSANQAGQRIGLVLEDTLSGRVEFYPTYQAGYPPAGLLLYDFSLLKGDSIHHPNGTDNYLVDSVFYYTDFRNITRKVLWIYGASPNLQCYKKLAAVWIEGIGNTSKFFSLYVGCSIKPGEGSLKCVFDGGTKIYGDTVSTCYKIGIEEPAYNFIKTVIYPNPVKNKLHIQSELPIAKANIYSISGTLLLERNTVETTIDVSALKPGVFILELTDADGNIGRSKVLKE